MSFVSINICMVFIVHKNYPYQISFITFSGLYFIQLLIYNYCLLLNNWRDAAIILLLKKFYPNCAANYRPLLLICKIIKITEGIISDNVTKPAKYSTLSIVIIIVFYRTDQVQLHYSNAYSIGM